MSLLCHSCNTKLPAYLSECPLCGAARPYPLPHVFLLPTPMVPPKTPPLTRSSNTGLVTPAYGRRVNSDESAVLVLPLEAAPQLKATTEGTPDSSKPLIALFFKEFLLLGLVNCLIFIMEAWALGVSSPELLSKPYIFSIVLLHLSYSWMIFITPLALMNQTPLMPYINYSINRCYGFTRMLFSIVHGLSVFFWPVTWVFIYTHKTHRTPAEHFLGVELRPTT